MVERHVANVNVVGSTPIIRSNIGLLAQLVERLLYTQDAGGSSPSEATTIALVMELVYILVLETRFWGFDSPLAHQHYGDYREVNNERVSADCTMAERPWLE